MQIAPTEMQWDGHPTPRAEDLAAYDALLAGASNLSFYAGRNVKDVAVMTYSVAVDGALGALTIRVNHDRAQPGKSLSNVDPFDAFVADVLLGDGSDGRVVQTVTCAGRRGVDYYKTPVADSQSMDRGGAKFGLRHEPATDENCGCWDCKKCQSAEHAYVVVRADGGGVRLAATPALNGAKCRRCACDVLCSIPTFFSGPVCMSICWARPNEYYELQDDARAPLGGARYTEVGHTFCAECCNGLERKRINLGSAPLQARQDLVAMLVLQIGAAASVVVTA
jgi:hypothetical protein